MKPVTIEELIWSLRLMKLNKPDALFLYGGKYLRRDAMIAVFENAIERIAK